MARCCGGSGCSCKVVGGRNIQVTGSGTADDPFSIQSIGSALNVQDSTQFNLILSGGGTTDDPWTLQVVYANGASLNNVPDVSQVAPTNGQVLMWNSTTSQWEPANSTTAAAGSVLTDGQSLGGDGSTGAPLHAVGNDARYINITANGIGLNDAGVNRMIRIYADAPTRDADMLAPEVGTVAILQNNPTDPEVWDGTEWAPLSGGWAQDFQSGQLLNLSGFYAGGTATEYVAQINVVTNTDGTFDLIPAADLTNYAGVLGVWFTPTGTFAFQVVVTADSTNGKIVGTAYRMDDGTALAGYTVTGVVRGLLY